jgi:hypothetical protein
MNGRFAPFTADGSVAAAAVEGKFASRLARWRRDRRTASLRMLNQPKR